MGKHEEGGKYWLLLFVDLVILKYNELSQVFVDEIMLQNPRMLLILSHVTLRR